MNRHLLPDALRLLVRAVNALLTADGSPQRVTSRGITVTRRNGYTIIAFEETPDETPDEPPGDVPPPIDRTHLRRDPARERYT